MANIKEEYKYFIENCSNVPNEFPNYSDFSRICKTIASIKGVDNFDIYSITSISEFDGILKDLELSEEYQAFNEKGQKQDSSALTMYSRFLKARSFFKSENYCDASAIKDSLSLQQIFYGAPGTGKSHRIKELTKGEDVVRTTFHPDTDYSSFVGAYKPTTREIPVYTIKGEKAVAVEGADGKPMTEDKIVYEFVEQAFLQAYVAAWKKYGEAKVEDTPKDEYLIIEEINRGNCAQIFGDLFQLLDRGDEGFSEYPIKADADMKKQLAKEFASLEIKKAASINALFKGETDVVGKVLSGEILLLPNNLYIWATMNTSDQSLFPIDSAFKRRWDWQYVPIGDAGKGWTIEVNGNKYDWWQFLSAINKRVYEATYSEDKKLGYFFCKAKDSVITADQFVSKVIFYLWNDVFKDSEFEGDAFKDENSDKLSFDKFYIAEGKVNTANVELFLKNLGLVTIELKETSTSSNAQTASIIKVNGKEIKYINAVPYTTIEEYTRLNPQKTAQEIVDLWKPFAKYSTHSWIIANKEEIEKMEPRYANYSYKIECSDGNHIWINKDGWMHNPQKSSLRDTIGEFIRAVNEANLGITITEENI